MAQKSKSTAQTRTAQVREIYTLERAVALAPTAKGVAALTQAFALEPVDDAGIRSTAKDIVIRLAETLKPNLKDQALEIHLQRIVGSFVASACGAGNFYSAKVGTARDLTSKLANDARDEDRDPVYGFESRAQRARVFAAEMGLQAFALLAAAKGAVEAFADATGSEWKPYVPDQTTTPGVTRRAAEAELAAFDAT